MPRRSKVGGARSGAGRKPVAGVARQPRTIKLTPDEAAAQDAAAAAAGKTWPDWIRGAAARELDRTMAVMQPAIDAINAGMAKR